jgi:hypothetical protein
VIIYAVHLLWPLINIPDQLQRKILNNILKVTSVPVPDKPKHARKE